MMRLLNVKNFKVAEFHGDNIEKYAILSHTWSKDDKDEVSFQDITGSLEDAMQKAGFEKIRYCAEQAREDGYNWCWIDTCCIDKSSSAELTEAINSMYAWYKASGVCYAYLVDVNERRTENQREKWNRLFASSHWFTRSWTLQELIAPSHLRFFGQRWIELGTREELLDTISGITRIQRDVLIEAAPEKASIAQRMCWASKRSAKRIEDKAYSLMGLFDVNMPLLYGEGTKAFRRLQEEIIKSADDETIFAWTNPHAKHYTYSGLLAHSPSYFEDTHDVIPSQDWKRKSEPFSVTNKGLYIQFTVRHNKEELEAYAQLSCYKKHKDKVQFIRIRPLLPESDQWVRVDPRKLYTTAEVQTERSFTPRMFFRQNIQLPDDHSSNRVRGFRLLYKSLEVTTVCPPESDSTDEGFVEIPPGSHFFEARVLFRSTISTDTIVIELEYNGASQLIPSKLQSHDINPLGFVGKLSWVKLNYNDITKPPTSEDCAHSDDWRGYRLHMKLVLVNNDLFIDVRIPSRMDEEKAVSSHDEFEIHKSIAASQFRVPGPGRTNKELSPQSKLPNYGPTNRSLTMPQLVTDVTRTEKINGSPKNEVNYTPTSPGSEYANHDIRSTNLKVLSLLNTEH
jgi:heterokaryon incompatibility protein (HET)